MANKLGIALVGLGEYSKGQLAPALKETEHCYLAGLVSGSREKALQWASEYKVPEKNIYDYNNFDDIANNKDIDIIYVVLPNSMHKEFVLRAARAGKHVITERPMATSIKDCEEMISACKQAGVILSVGYRLHFEPHNLEMMRHGRDQTFGSINKIIALNGMAGTQGWRLNKQLAGGGPLMDVGIYCVQGARYTTGLEPIAVTAEFEPTKDTKTFSEVEESIRWTLEFPNNIIAECRTSYSEEMNLLRAEATNGWFELSPAYEYEGIKGRTIRGDMEVPNVNQQARQMDDFALAIEENRPTPVPGEMGLQDVKILLAIYKAAETGQRVEIS